MINYEYTLECLYVGLPALIGIAGLLYCLGYYIYKSVKESKQ